MAPFGLLPVLTGSRSLIVKEGLSPFAAAVSPGAIAAAVSTRGTALGAAGVLKLLGSEAAVALCLPFSAT